MIRVEIKDNQTLLDIAMEYYGAIEAIGEILVNNPHITNDIKTIIDIDRPINEFHPDIKLTVGSILLINDDSRTIKKTVVRSIDRSVNTYTTGSWEDQLNK